MSIAGTLLLKYGVTIAKAIYALKVGEPSVLSDLFLDPSKDWLNQRAKDQETKALIEKTRDQVLRGVQSQIKFAGEYIRLEDIVEAVDETFQAGFSFESIVENLESPRAIPPLWRARRSHFSNDDDVFILHHDRLLTETVRAIIKILPELPGFQNWLLGYITRHIKEQNTINQAFLDLLTQDQVRDIQFANRYRKALRAKLDRVELFIEGSDFPAENREQELTVAYVTLELAHGREGQRPPTTLDANALLDDLQIRPQRVLIVGPAGSGKTTLLRWLGLEAISGKQDPIKWTYLTADRLIQSQPSDEDTWRNKIPFLIRLRDCKEGSFPSPNQFHSSGISGQDAPDGWAQRILDAGRGLILLDGLDELPPARRVHALDWIQELTASLHEDNIIVVSSRPQAVSPDALISAGFQEYSVQELSPSGKIEFVRKWHEAVRRRLQASPERIANLAAKQAQLLTEMRDNRSVSLLASNPLLCALLCALNRVYQQSLPEGLHDLCANACKMLLWDRDHLQGIARRDFFPNYDELTSFKRLVVCQHLAYALVADDTPVLSRTSAIDIIATTLQGATNPDRTIASDVLKGLIDRSGLLRECGEDEIEFVHNALRDYLASLLIVQRKDSNILVRKIDGADLEKWEPILLFAASTKTDHTFGGILLKKLLALKKQSDLHRRHRELIALKVKAYVQGPIDSDMETRLADIRASMLPIDTPEKAVWLAEAGDAAFEYLRWEEGRAEDVAAVCVQGLSKMKIEQAVTELQVYLQRDQRPAVLDALAPLLPPEVIASAVNILQIPSVLQLIQMDRLLGAVAYHIKDLTPLQGLSHITRLNLDGTQIGDLTPLQGLINLEKLSLGSTSVSDLAVLKNFLNLRELSLDQTPITDTTALQGLSHLTMLDLTGTQISDLTPLQGLTSLKVLLIVSTSIRDFAQLKCFPQLSTLYLSVTQTSDLTPLQELAQLSFLYLTGTQICDLTPLQGLTNLKELFLETTSVVDLTPLQGLQNRNVYTPTTPPYRTSGPVVEGDYKVLAWPKNEFNLRHFSRVRP